MRTFLLTLIAIAFAVLLPAVAGAQTAERPLPKFVQKLSPADFKLWAAWQNRQAAARQAEQADDPLAPDPYLHGSRLIATSTAHTAGIGTGGNGKRNNAILGYTDVYATSTQAIESRHTRYANPDYTPTPQIIYNPYVQPSEENGLGDPDWNSLFVPCEKGTMTMTEALMKERGPIDPERLYMRLLAPFLLD